MATATPTRPNPAAARDAAVEQAIAAAAGKVRSNDLLTGAAAAAVLFLGYLAMVVTLDKLLDLPDWVRLLGLFGLLGGLGAVAYYLVVRPMQRRVNPRYIARKMEETMPDAKNVLINWVDLQDEQLPGSVKAAVGAKAAEGVADADVDSATNSKKLIWLGSAVGVLVLVLAVLFLVFSGPQFFSLLGRAVVPFKPTEIASATTISIDEPDGGDVTITDGQPLSIVVTVGGRVPNPNGPDKPRLLVRYSQDDTEEIELPLTAVGSSREYRTDLGRGTILNGFWYRVAAGDARTPEHQVKVITRPMLTEFKASYEYPAYMKMQSDETKGPKLQALRGTVVTLTTKANRTIQSATLTAVTVDGTREAVRGEVFDKDHVRFKLKLSERGTYRIDFKPTGPELSTATADYPIEVDTDPAPTVTITQPEEEETAVPINGWLPVNGEAKDNHGLTGVELRFRLIDAPTLAIRPQVVFTADELRRGDGSQTDKEQFKRSVRPASLRDSKGQALTLKEGDVIEFWAVATDDCTEPTANVGQSKPKKVRLLAPIKEPERKEQANKQLQREEEENKDEQERKDRLKDAKQPEEQKHNPDHQQQEKQPPNGEKPNQDPMKQEGDPQKTEGQNNQQTKPDGQQGKPNGEQGDTPPNPEQEKKEKEFKEKMEQRKQQEKEQAGDARGNGDKSEGAETKPDAGSKPQEGKQGDGGSKDAAQEKAPPKPEDMNKPEGQPGEGKDGGHLTEPQRSEGKAPPKQDAKGEDKPTDDQPKNAPKQGTEAGTSKESKEGTKPEGSNQEGTKPEGTKPDKGNPEGTKPENNKKQDGSAGSARGAEPPPQGDKPQEPNGTGNDTQQPKEGKEKKVDPKDLGNSKPKGEPTRGNTKPEKGSGNEKTEQPKDAGEAKGETPNKPGESKDQQPKGNGNEPMPKKGPPSDAGQEKQPPKEGADGKEGASEPKGEGKKPEQGSKNEGEKGSVKPSDTTKKPDGSGKQEDKNPTPGGDGEKNPDKTQGGGKGEKNLDQKGMEQAIKDLESKDDKTKKDAQEKLDKAIGKGNREQIEQAQKDLKSDDKAKQDAAKQKLEDMAKKAQEDQKNAGGGGGQKKELTEQEKKELIEAAKNLNSENPQTKKDAQEKLDKAMGKENREKLEKMQKDLKSEDKATREAAEKELQEMAKNAQQKGNQDTTAQKQPEMTEEEKKALNDAAGKLNSKDEGERKAAEQKIDEAIGKEKRQELQQDLKDLQGNDPAKAEQARKKLEKKMEEAKNAQGGNSDRHENRPNELGGGNNKTPGKPIDANLENQLKSEELRLDDIRKYQGDKQFLKDSNITDEEYNRFLKKQEEAVQKLRDKVDHARLNPTPKASGPATVGRNDGSTDRVKGRGNADKVDAKGGPPQPPPGFGDAIRRFNTEASKQK